MVNFFFIYTIDTSNVISATDNIRIGGDFIFSIQDSLRFKLAKALQNIDVLFAKELMDTGITSKHYGTMLIVKENPNITQIEVAKIQRIDRTTARQLVDFLEKNSY